MPAPSEALDSSVDVSNHHNLTQFLAHVQLCQIMSEIHGVQFFDQAIPKDTLLHEAWMLKMERSIQMWQDCSTSDGETPGWTISSANHCRLLLYRPCSRNIAPSEPSLRAASTVAIRTINGYWEVVKAGNLVFAYQYVFNIFQAGMVLLYALRNHGPTLRDAALEEDAYRALSLLTQLFVSDLLISFCFPFP